MKAALESMLKAVRENLAKLEADPAVNAKAIRATRVMERELVVRIQGLAL